MDNYYKLSKKYFKKLHADGGLLLVDAGLISKERAIEAINEYDGDLHATARNVGRADVDGSNTAIWTNEEYVLVENKPGTGKPHTTIYVYNY